MVESSSLDSVPFREAFSHPYISYFHLLVIVFVLLVSVLFCGAITFLILVGRYWWAILVGSISGWGIIKMVSSSTPSANQPDNDLILSHSTAKPMIKAQISGRMISSVVSDVAFALVYSEKTCLKKLMMKMMMIIIIIIIVITEKLFTSKWRCRDG